MNIKSIIIFSVSLLYFSPLYADYSKEKNALENYTPPGFYTDYLETGTEKTEPRKPDATATKALARIRDLKLEFEKAVGNDPEIEFLSGIDPDVVKSLSRMALDSEAVQKRVADKIEKKEIEVFAALRNPGVLAAKKKLKAGLESFSQVMDLDENLRQYSAFTRGLENKAGPSKMSGSNALQYPFPGLTSLKGRIIQQKVAALKEKIRIAGKNVITGTRKAYWEMVFVERSIQVTSDTMDALDRLKDVAVTLHRSGKTSFQDIIKINIKIEELKETLVTLLSQKRNIEVRMNELLNLPLTTRLGRVVKAPSSQELPTLENLYPLALRNRQELKVIRHNVQRIQGMIELAESMIQSPSFLNLSVYEDNAVKSVGTIAEKNSFPEKTMASMKNNRPLKPWYGIDDPWLNQTRQNLLSLKQTLAKEENATGRMVSQAWYRADKNVRELLLYQDRILPLSGSALEVSTRGYESGSIPFSQAIDSYTYWLKVKLTIAKKQTDLGKALAALENLIGSSF